MSKVLLLALVAAVATAPASARVGTQSGFPVGECTSWAYAKRPAIVDLTILRTLNVRMSANGAIQLVQPISGWDAWLWTANAHKGGFAVGTRPAVGAIAVWPRNTDGAGPIGHVAFVEKVLAAGAFAVSEENWEGRRHPTHRVVSANRSLRFIYRRADEPQRQGTGSIVRISSTQGADGKTPSATLRMSGRGDVLFKLIGPHGFVKEAVRTLPAGTSALVLSELTGSAHLASGYYTLAVILAGSGGNYQYLELYVPGA
jgi:surface antigen